MADRNLAIKIVFDALDRLSAPLKRMTQTTASLNRTASETARRLADIRRGQAQIASYTAAEKQLRETATALAVAKRKSAELRAEIGASVDPPKRLAAALAKAERSEATLTERHERQGAALEQLQRKLNAAGIEVADLARHEQRLAEAAHETSRSLERQQQRLARIERARERGRKAVSVGGTVAGAGAIASATVGAPVIALLVSSTRAAQESAQAMAQVNASIASMGPAAGRTLPQLQAMAGKLQDVSLYDDDDILKKVTSTLLTFGKISGKTFDDAQLAAVNLTAKFGGDLQARAIQVGKALNDPVKGIAALSRVGVSFDPAQKKLIKRLVETGNVAGAQQLILAELNREVGGSAEAARKANPGGALAVEWRNFQETVGSIVLKYLPPLLAQLTKLLDWFNSADPATQGFIIALAAIAAAAGPVITVIGTIISVVGGLAAVLGVSFLAAGGIIIAAVAAIAAAVYLIYRNWTPIKAFFISLWNFIEARFRAGLAFWQSLGPTFAAIGRAMLQGLIGALNPLVLVRHILGLGSTIVTTLKSVLGIKSPSRVFAGIGDQMMAGLSMGLDRGVDGPLDRLRRGSARMTAALAGASIGVAPAAATIGAVGAPSLSALAPRPSIGATSLQGGAPQRTIIKNYTYYITLQGGAGADMKAQARAFRDELKRLEAIEDASSYRDEEGD